MTINEIVLAGRSVMREVFAREVPDADDPRVIFGSPLEESTEESVEEFEEEEGVEP